MNLAEALLDLQRLTERLRAECPWDREQTAKTIVPHTVEEAYEVADAALGGDPGKLLDELGDLLFQAFFLSLLLEEKGYGGLEAVARNVHEKLVRRHPHVFGEAEAATPGEVRRTWEDVKRATESRAEIFHHVPETLPSLLFARKVQRRAAAVGFDYRAVDPMVAHLHAELDELKVEIERTGKPKPETEPDARVVDEVGDVLFSVVNLARALNVDPELALRQTAQKFVTRVEEAERLAGREGRDWGKLPLEEQNHYYDRVKEEPAE